MLYQYGAAVRSPAEAVYLLRILAFWQGKAKSGSPASTIGPADLKTHATRGRIRNRPGEVPAIR